MRWQLRELLREEATGDGEQDGGTTTPPAETPEKPTKRATPSEEPEWSRTLNMNVTRLLSVLTPEGKAPEKAPEQPVAVTPPAPAEQPAAPASPAAAPPAAKRRGLMVRLPKLF